MEARYPSFIFNDSNCTEIKGGKKNSDMTHRRLSLGSQQRSRNQKIAKKENLNKTFVVYNKEKSTITISPTKKANEVPLLEQKPVNTTIINLFASEKLKEVPLLEQKSEIITITSQENEIEKQTVKTLTVNESEINNEYIARENSPKAVENLTDTSQNELEAVNMDDAPQENAIAKDNTKIIENMDDVRHANDISEGNTTIKIIEDNVGDECENIDNTIISLALNEQVEAKVQTELAVIQQKSSNCMRECESQTKMIDNVRSELECVLYISPRREDPEISAISPDDHKEVKVTKKKSCQCCRIS